jgi:aconitate hydratase
VEKYFKTHYRLDDFKRLQPGTVSYYDRLVKIDLSRIEPMIALPFHPSNAFTIKEANENAGDLLHQVEEEGKKLLGRSDIELNVHSKVKNGRILVDQGIVAGCAGGTFENIFAVHNIMENHSIGNTEFALSIYPASQPIFREMLNRNIATRLIDTGVTIRTAFCGPCFGAGDIPANRMLSVRHTTRNFPNREGSKPAEGQIASVALMDARSIAATAINKGTLTSAAELDIPVRSVAYYFDKTVYEKRIFNGFGKPQSEEELKFGPNIVDWPQMIPLPDNLLLQVCSVIHDPVTTTDELIPSGETSSYRSNPLKLASFTLSRKDPDYVPRAKGIQHLEQDRQQFVKNSSREPLSAELASIFQNHLEKHQFFGGSLESVVNSTALGSVIVAVKPGDGSAREQAASCQKVLGGWANVAVEYATKRYRSNVINWGMFPFIVNEQDLKRFETGDFLYVPDIKNSLASGKEVIEVYILNTTKKETLQLRLPGLTSAERETITAGCLMNYYKLFD